jgi:hypothetical protein
MRIRLLQNPGNFAFERKPTRHYVMKAASEWYHPCVSDFVRGERACFLYGQVRLWVLNKPMTRLMAEYYISPRFAEEAAYLSAVRDGFEVERGAERAARLLIAHSLVERLDV